jgi:hypothetical protein
MCVCFTSVRGGRVPISEKKIEFVGNCFCMIELVCVQASGNAMDNPMYNVGAPDPARRAIPTHTRTEGDHALVLNELYTRNLNPKP